MLALSTAQEAALDTRLVKTLEAADIAPLITGQMKVLTTLQMAAMEVADLKALNSD